MPAPAPVLPVAADVSFLSAINDAVAACLPSAREADLPSALDSTLPSALNAPLPSALEASLPSALEASLAALNTAINDLINVGVPAAVDEGVNQAFMTWERRRRTRWRNREAFQSVIDGKQQAAEAHVTMPEKILPGVGEGVGGGGETPATIPAFGAVPDYKWVPTSVEGFQALTLAQIDTLARFYHDTFSIRVSENVATMRDKFRLWLCDLD